MARLSLDRVLRARRESAEGWRQVRQEAEQALEQMERIARQLDRIERFDANRGRLDASPAPAGYKLNTVGHDVMADQLEKRAVAGTVFIPISTAVPTASGLTISGIAEGSAAFDIIERRSAFDAVVEMGGTASVGQVSDMQTTASGEVFVRATITDAVARAKVAENVYSGLEVTTNALGRIERVALVDRPTDLEKRSKTMNKAVLDKVMNDLQAAERRLVAVVPRDAQESRDRLVALHQLRRQREDLAAKASPIAVGGARDNDDAELAVVRSALSQPIIGGDALMRHLNRFADH